MRCPCCCHAHGIALLLPSIYITGGMPLQVLLLDEVTVDMDVVARLDLLEFLR